MPEGAWSVKFETEINRVEQRGRLMMQFLTDNKMPIPKSMLKD